MLENVLLESARRKAAETARIQLAIAEAHGAQMAACAQTMAAAFESGGRLYVFGNGGSACDAQHVAVEFMHPVLEKRPALPALALNADTAVLSAVGNDGDFSMVFAEQLRALARTGDIAMGISTSGKSRNVVRGLQTARELGLLTVGLTGRDGGRMEELCDHCFRIPSFSIHRIQEAHGLLIHSLWDLLHLARGEEDVL